MFYLEKDCHCFHPTCPKATVCHQTAKSVAKCQQRTFALQQIFLSCNSDDDAVAAFANSPCGSARLDARLTPKQHQRAQAGMDGVQD